MGPIREYKRPYLEPPPRSFANWCIDLGLQCEGNCPEENDIILTYDDFCFYPHVKFLKINPSSLYGFWRVYGDMWGECRTIREWLEDFKWKLVNPTRPELQDLDLFIGHD